MPSKESPKADWLGNHGRRLFEECMHARGWKVVDPLQSTPIRQYFDSHIRQRIEEVFNWQSGGGGSQCELLSIGQAPALMVFECLVLFSDSAGKIGIPMPDAKLAWRSLEGDGEFVGLVVNVGFGAALNVEEGEFIPLSMLGMAPFFSPPFFRGESRRFVQGQHNNAIGSVLSELLSEKVSSFAGIGKACLSLESTVAQSRFLIIDRQGREYVVGLAVMENAAGVEINALFPLDLSRAEGGQKVLSSQALAANFRRALAEKGNSLIDVEEFKDEIAAAEPFFRDFLQRSHGLVWQDNWRVSVDAAAQDEHLNLAQFLISVRDENLNCVVPMAPAAAVIDQAYSGFVLGVRQPFHWARIAAHLEEIPFSVRCLAYRYARWREDRSANVEVETLFFMFSHAVVEKELSHFMRLEKDSFFYRAAASAISEEVLGDRERAGEIEIRSVKTGPFQSRDGVNTWTFAVKTREGCSLMCLVYDESSGLVNPEAPLVFIDFFRAG